MEADPDRTGLRGLAATRYRVHGQAGLYVVATALVGVLGIAAQALVARTLDVDGFAVYAFCLAFLQFFAIFFEFGLFIPAARRAALADGTERRAIVGGALALYVPVGVAFCAFAFAASFVVDAFVPFDAAPTLRAAAAVAFAFPFMLVAQSLAQGTDRLHVFSLSSVLWQILFVTALALLAVTDVDYGSPVAVLLRGATLAAGAAVLCVWMRPLFGRMRERIELILADAREYGRSIYIGRVLSTASYNVDILLVGLLADAEAVAFYALAKALAYGVGLPGLGGAAALFPRMARAPRLAPRWIWIAAGVGGAGALVLALIASPLIDLVYGPEFAGAAALVLPLALAEAMRGVAGFPNQFFNAHGEGRAIRRVGIVFTVTNLIANLALIPPFGAEGAAWASFGAMLINLASYRREYLGLNRSTA
jgi:O-antigen/teichoic acid export membrane protein